jgi:hypothetical protein
MVSVWPLPEHRPVGSGGIYVGSKSKQQVTEAEEEHRGQDLEDLDPKVVVSISVTCQ